MEEHDKLLQFIRESGLVMDPSQAKVLINTEDGFNRAISELYDQHFSTKGISLDQYKEAYLSKVGSPVGMLESQAEEEKEEAEIQEEVKKKSTDGGVETSSPSESESTTSGSFRDNFKEQPQEPTEEVSLDDLQQQQDTSVFDSSDNKGFKGSFQFAEPAPETDTSGKDFLQPNNEMVFDSSDTVRFNEQALSPQDKQALDSGELIAIQNEGVKDDPRHLYGKPLGFEGNENEGIEAMTSSDWNSLTGAIDRAEARNLEKILFFEEDSPKEYQPEQREHLAAIKQIPLHQRNLSTVSDDDLSLNAAVAFTQESKEDRQLGDIYINELLSREKTTREQGFAPRFDPEMGGTALRRHLARAAKDVKILEARGAVELFQEPSLIKTKSQELLVKQFANAYNIFQQLDGLDTKKKEEAKARWESGREEGRDHGFGERFLDLNNRGLRGILSIAPAIPRMIGQYSETLQGGDVNDPNRANEYLGYRFANWLEDAANDNIPVNEIWNKELRSSVASGIGQGASQLLLAGLFPQSRLPMIAMSAQMATGGFEDAIASGGTKSDALISFAVNGALGGIEKINAARVLKRFEGLDPKQWKAVLAKTLQGSAEEGFEEMVQQFGGNMTAKQLYDETRDLSKGVMESAGVGSIVGAVLNGFSGTVNALNYKELTPEERVMADATREILDALKNGTGPESGVPLPNSTGQELHIIPKKGVLSQLESEESTSIEENAKREALESHYNTWDSVDKADLIRNQKAWEQKWRTLQKTPETEDNYDRREILKEELKVIERENDQLHHEQRLRYHEKKQAKKLEEQKDETDDIDLFSALEQEVQVLKENIGRTNKQRVELDQDGEDVKSGIKALIQSKQPKSSVESIESSNRNTELSDSEESQPTSPEVAETVEPNPVDTKPTIEVVSDSEQETTSGIKASNKVFPSEIVDTKQPETAADPPKPVAKEDPKPQPEKVVTEEEIATVNLKEGIPSTKQVETKRLTVEEKQEILKVAAEHTDAKQSQLDRAQAFGKAKPFGTAGDASTRAFRAIRNKVDKWDGKATSESSKAVASKKFNEETGRGQVSVGGKDYTVVTTKSEGAKVFSNETGKEIKQSPLAKKKSKSKRVSESEKKKSTDNSTRKFAIEAFRNQQTETQAEASPEVATEAAPKKKKTKWSEVEYSPEKIVVDVLAATKLDPESVSNETGIGSGERKGKASLWKGDGKAKSLEAAMESLSKEHPGMFGDTNDSSKPTAFDIASDLIREHDSVGSMKESIQEAYNQEQEVDPEWQAEQDAKQEELAVREVDESNVDKIRDKIEQDKEALKSLWEQGKNLGITIDPKESAKRDAEMIKKAAAIVNGYMKLGVATIQDVVNQFGAKHGKALGDKLGKLITDRWDDIQPLLTSKITPPVGVKVKKPKKTKPKKDKPTKPKTVDPKKTPASTTPKSKAVTPATVGGLATPHGGPVVSRSGQVLKQGSWWERLKVKLDSIAPSRKIVSGSKPTDAKYDKTASAAAVAAAEKVETDLLAPMLDGVRKVRAKSVEKYFQIFSTYFFNKTGNTQRALERIGGSDVVRKIGTAYNSKGRSKMEFKELDKKILGGLSPEKRNHVGLINFLESVIDIDGRVDRHNAEVAAHNANIDAQNVVIKAENKARRKKGKKEKPLKKGKKKPRPTVKHPKGDMAVALNGSRAKNTLDALKAAWTTEYWNDIHGRAEQVNAVMQEYLGRKELAGVIKPEVYAALKPNWYSPRHFAQHLDKMAKGADDLSIDNSGVKKLQEGSEEALVLDVGELMYRVIHGTNQIIAKNEAVLELVNLARRNPPDPTQKEWTVRFEPDAQSKSPPPGYDYVNAMDNGLIVSVSMPKVYATEMKAAQMVTEHAAIGWTGIFAGAPLLRLLATGANPMFAVANYIRDVVEITTLHDHFNPSATLGLLQITGYNAVQIKDILSDNKAYQAEVKEYIEMGLSMDFLGSQGIEQWTRDVPLNYGSKIMNKALEMGAWLSNQAEILNRVAVVRKAIKNRTDSFKKKEGRDPNADEATHIKKMAVGDSVLVMPFTQGGRLTKTGNQIIPYLNAGFLGLANLHAAGTIGQVSSRNTDGRSSVTRTYTKLAEIGAWSAVIAASAFSYPEWKDVDKNVREANWIVFLPDWADTFIEEVHTRDENGVVTERGYMAIPKAQSVRPIAAMGEAAAEAIFNRKSNADWKAATARAILPPITQAPPSFSAFVAYNDLDLFTMDKVWKGPKVSSGMEYWQHGFNKTPRGYVWIGKHTGFSPHRGRVAVNKVTANWEKNLMVSPIFSASAEVWDLYQGEKTKGEAVTEFAKDFAKVGSYRFIKKTRPQVAPGILEKALIRLDKMSGIMHNVTARALSAADMEPEAQKELRAEAEAYLVEMGLREKQVANKLRAFDRVARQKDAPAIMRNLDFALDTEMRVDIFIDHIQGMKPEQLPNFVEQVNRYKGINTSDFRLVINPIFKEEAKKSSRPYRWFLNKKGNLIKMDPKNNVQYRGQ